MVKRLKGKILNKDLFDEKNEKKLISTYASNSDLSSIKLAPADFEGKTWSYAYRLSNGNRATIFFPVTANENSMSVQCWVCNSSANDCFQKVSARKEPLGSNMEITPGSSCHWQFVDGPVTARTRYSSTDGKNNSACKPKQGAYASEGLLK